MSSGLCSVRVQTPFITHRSSRTGFLQLNTSVTHLAVTLILHFILGFSPGKDPRGCVQHLLALLCQVALAKTISTETSQGT